MNISEHKILGGVINGDNQLHFGCNGCGQCCRGGQPEVMLTELVGSELNGLKDNTPGTSFICSLGLRLIPNPISKYSKIGTIDLNQEDVDSLTSFNNDTFPVMDMKGKKVNIMLFAKHAGYEADVLTSCIHLKEDNKCGIYEHRPIICKIAPLDSFVPMSLQLHRVSRLVDNFDCDIRDSDPSLFEVSQDNSGKKVYKILDVGYKKDFDDKIKMTQQNKEYIELLFKLFDGITFPKMDYFNDRFIKNNKDNYWVELPIAPAIALLVQHKKLTIDEARIFLKTQNNLIGKEIELAYVRKNKEERERTEMLVYYMEVNNQVMTSFE